ncbi:MAG: hypothetical protein DMF99_31525 [Acidobacteria bacterium]|nr:MAG: hypothetical protein DMF99_31525 [Acidobacteriota bacterium]
MRLATVPRTMSRLRTVTAALVLLMGALWAFSNRPNPSSKVDRALRDWIQHPTTTSIRALIKVVPAAGPRVSRRLHRSESTTDFFPSTTPDLVVAELSATALRAAARDPEVINISTDARVKSLSTSYLSQDVLLATEALLPRTYAGENIGVAVIDSGVLPSGDAKYVVVTYDFTAGGATKVDGQDPFGHGTHVSGLIASTGATSNDLYEGIAPATRLIALRALDQNGSGYTSNVINAINFAVANKSNLGIDIINLSLGLRRHHVAR